MAVLIENSISHSKFYDYIVLKARTHRSDPCEHIDPLNKIISKGCLINDVNTLNSVYIANNINVVINKL